MLNLTIIYIFIYVLKNLITYGVLYKEILDHYKELNHYTPPPKKKILSCWMLENAVVCHHQCPNSYQDKEKLQAFQANRLRLQSESQVIQ